MQDGPATGRLMVLIALGDGARAERLASALARQDGVVPMLADGRAGNDRADVVIVDGDPVDAVTPHVLLWSGEEPRHAAAIAAILPTGSDDRLIAAAARLAAAGYGVSRGGGSFDPHDGFAGNGFLDEDAVHDPGGRPALSPREVEVLALLAEGAPNKVIARRLDISVHTAKFHVAAILAKLGAANRTDAIAIAMRQGLVLV